METNLTSVFVFLFLVGCAWSEVTKAPGHLQRFGEGRKSSVAIDVTEGFPTPILFFGKYVQLQRPLLMKGAAKLSVAFTLWTDEYFSQHPEAKETYVGVETGKKENRSAPTFDSTFAGYINIYKKKDVYLVNRTPIFLRRDIMVPCPIQCSKLLQNHIHTIYMWFSSGGTKSVVHNDNLENINCLFRGDKQLVMVDPSKFTIPFDHPDQGFSSVDVDSVDYTKYPWAADLEFQHVNMTAGDCLYIPTNWYHQVNSNGSNLAVNIWIEPESLQTYDIGDCNEYCDLSLTMDKAKLFTQDKTDILDSIPEDKAMTTGEFIRHIVSSNKMDVEIVSGLPEYAEFAEWVGRILKAVTKEQDGVVTKTVVASLSPKSWHQLTHTLESLQLASSNAMAMMEEGMASDITPDELVDAMTDKQKSKKEEL